MAKLHKEIYPGEWEKLEDEDWDRYSRRVGDLFDAIPIDRIMSFPVADGKALYFVFSEKPFVLQHIPYGDAWRIPDAHLRGLNISDWRRQQKFNKLWENWKSK